MTTLQPFRGIRQCRVSLRQLRAHLPATPEEIEDLLGLAAEHDDAEAFNNLLQCALDAGHGVDARWLPTVNRLTTDPRQMAAAVVHSRGDVAEVLVPELVHQRSLALARLITLIAWWCQQQAREIPQVVRHHARNLVRTAQNEKRLGAKSQVILGLMEAPVIITSLSNDPELGAMVQDVLGEEYQGARLAFMTEFHLKTLMGPARQNPLWFLPEKPENATAGAPGPKPEPRSGQVRPGRNDPCHCGSGKKYKKCCYRTDQQRQRQEAASQVVEAIVPERLTQESLEALSSEAVEQLDPTRVPPRLLQPALVRLIRCGVFETVTNYFLETPWNPELGLILTFAINFAANAQEAEVALRLVAFAEEVGETPQLDPIAWMLKILADEGPASELVEFLEDKARGVLDALALVKRGDLKKTLRSL